MSPLANTPPAAAKTLEETAASLARRLTISHPMPLRPQDAALLEGTESFRFGPDDSRLAWSVGKGPLVLLVHGYGGRGPQMAGLAHALASDGFRCVFFDAGGHGDSRSEPIGFNTFINDVGALTRFMGGKVHTWIGHSAGGLGMMASRELRETSADRYVCISAPYFPYIPLESLKRNAGASDEALELVKLVLAKQFETAWEDLQNGNSYPHEYGKPFLLAHDLNDEVARHGDADRISAQWPGAEVLKTSGYGHNKILQAPEVWSAVREFVSRDL